MKRKVIAAFDYAADGVHVNRLKAGRSYEFPADHAARFEVEGYLEPLAGARPAAASIEGEAVAVSLLRAPGKPAARTRKPKRR